MRECVLPSVGQLALQHVGEDTVGGFPDEGRVWEVGHQHGKYVGSAKRCIVGEQGNGTGKGAIRARRCRGQHVSRLHLAKVIIAGALLGLSMMPDTFLVHKTAHDLVHTLVGAARVKANVHNKAPDAFHAA